MFILENGDGPRGNAKERKAVVTVPEDPAEQAAYLAKVVIAAQTVVEGFVAEKMTYRLSFVSLPNVSNTSTLPSIARAIWHDGRSPSFTSRCARVRSWSTLSCLRRAQNSWPGALLATLMG